MLFFLRWRYETNQGSKFKKAILNHFICYGYTTYYHTQLHNHLDIDKPSMLRSKVENVVLGGELAFSRHPKTNG